MIKSIERVVPILGFSLRGVDELAERAGTATSTIRYYEELKLLHRWRKP